MPVHTNATAVELLLGDDYDAQRVGGLQPFIDTANAIIDSVEACAGTTLTESRLELMERWLSAHCYCQSDPTYANESKGGASGAYTGQTGMFLESTRYGQMALSLDSTGCLAEVTKPEGRPVAGGFWMGKRTSTRRTYRERN